MANHHKVNNMEHLLKDTANHHKVNNMEHLLKDMANLNQDMVNRLKVINLDMVYLLRALANLNQDKILTVDMVINNHQASEWTSYGKANF